MWATIQQIESQATPLRATMYIAGGRYFYTRYEFPALCKGCGEWHDAGLIQVMSVN